MKWFVVFVLIIGATSVCNIKYLSSVNLAYAEKFTKQGILRAARDFRDLNLAHHLTEDARKNPDLQAMFGDERRLLEITLPIVENLDLGIRDRSTPWQEVRDIAKRCAQALWNGCQFQVLE